MAVPCVRVPREEGETVRRALAEADLLDRGAEIDVEAGWIYLPVSDRAAVPAEYEVVERSVGTRETQTVPGDLLDFSPTYERLGDVVLLDEPDPDRAREAAAAIVASDLPVAAVVNKSSAIAGEERVREWDLLCGESTETVHREYGSEFLLDVTRVYFSPRLATERHRVVAQVEAGERVVDMFCGVGPFAIPMAKRGADVVAVDINDTAIQYLEENARRNGVSDRITAIHGDVREVTGDYEGWADRIVMNLPHSADEFLETAVALAGDDCVLHYYDIQDDDDPFGPGEAAIRAAAEPACGVVVEARREVRSYSPHAVNVCLDVRLKRG